MEYSLTTVLVSFVTAYIGYRIFAWFFILDPKLPPPVFTWSFLKIYQWKSYRRGLWAYINGRGDMCQMSLFGKRILFLNKFELTKEALLKQGVAFAGRPQLDLFKRKQLDQMSIFSQWGEKYKAHRQLLASAMKVLEKEQEGNSLEQSIIDNCETFLQRVAHGKPTGTHSELAITTSDTICKLLFGPDSMPTINTEIKENMARRLKPSKWTLKDAVSFLLRELLPRQIKRLIYGADQKAEKVNKNEIFERITDEQLSSYQEGHIRSLADALMKAAVPMMPNLLSLGFIQRSIVYSVKEFIDPGSRTAMQSLQWAFLYMATYPEMQARVREEIRDVIGHSRPPKSADMLEMPYTEAVMLETWRHAPFPHTLIPHATTEDTTLAGYFLPKDTIVVVNLWATSRDTRFWDDPDIYQPERFITQENGIRRLDRDKQKLVLAFGLGKRECLGKKMGKMEVFIILARVLQQCEIILMPEYKFDLTDVNLSGNPPDYQVIFKRFDE